MINMSSLQLLSESLQAKEEAAMEAWEVLITLLMVLTELE
jgi:hypothetical protein